jgi:hypothetical protein
MRSEKSASFCDNGSQVERFSNECALIQLMQGGFFLVKKPLDRSGFDV